MADINMSRQVSGSSLVDTSAKVGALAFLLQVDPRRVKLATLFSTAVGGWSNARAFHNACDNRGPTVTLLKIGSHFYGGYASIPWTSQKSWQNDDKAFLFRFYSGGGNRQIGSPEKFERNGAGQEIYHGPEWGPTFGRKHDLFTFGPGSQPLTDYGSSGSSSSFNVSQLFYNDGDRDASRTIMEVLSVQVEAAHFDLEHAWRTTVSWREEDVKRAQDCLFAYEPGSAGLPTSQVNILLCGGVGAGKSSIVSTVDGICQGRISRIASHGEGTGSLTRMLRKYSFTRPGTREPVKWHLWDSMGWGTEDYKRGELGFILDGHLPNRCQLDISISTQTKGFKLQPTLQDRVHCMLLVVPCQAASDEAYMARLNEMRAFAREREIPTLIFLTKIDTYDPDVIGASLSKTFLSGRLLQLVEELEQNSGVGGRKDIYPIKSLSHESGPTAELRALMCDAMMQALYAAEDYVRECPDGSSIASDLSL